MSIRVQVMAYSIITTLVVNVLLFFAVMLLDGEYPIWWFLTAAMALASMQMSYHSNLDKLYRNSSDSRDFWIFLGYSAINVVGVILSTIIKIIAYQI